MSDDDWEEVPLGPFKRRTQPVTAKCTMCGKAYVVRPGPPICRDKRYLYKFYLSKPPRGTITPRDTDIIVEGEELKG